MGKYEMVAMAIIAGGGHDESSFEQAFAMDTLGIIG
jgi:hypothetical protein